MTKKRKKDGRRKGSKTNSTVKVQQAAKQLTKKLSVALFDPSVRDRDSRVVLGNQKYLKPAKRRGPQCFGYNCVQAWDFIDPKGDKRVSEWGREHSVVNVRKLYHGTPFHNLGGISNSSLKCGRGGMFGGAIYLTPDLPKALGYTGHGSQTYYVLEVQANLGRVLLCKEADHCITKASLAEKGFHSVEGRGGATAAWIGTLAHTEFAVYDPRQVCITGILAYQRREVGALRV